MPTVIVVDGFSLRVNIVEDGEEQHVHVVKGGAEYRVRLHRSNASLITMGGREKRSREDYASGGPPTGWRWAHHALDSGQARELGRSIA